MAYNDTVERLLGSQVDFRFLTEQKKGHLQKTVRGLIRNVVLEFFQTTKKTTANLAKERLRIVLLSDAAAATLHHHTAATEEDILKCIAKVCGSRSINGWSDFRTQDDDISVLELNVKLPEEDR